MMALSKRRGGFTLIELMIVVAIIGILAAIAIPNFIRFQLRSKTSEGKSNLAAIRTAQEGYFSEFGTFVQAAIAPAALPGSAKALWPVPAPACPLCFDTVGWAPEGQVFFQYQVGVNSVSGMGVNDEFFGYATADIDGDGAGAGMQQEWQYAKPVPGAMGVGGGVLGLGCNAMGAYNPVSMANDLLSTVGPCDNASGQSVF